MTTRLTTARTSLAWFSGVRGFVRRIEAERLLEYEYTDPHSREFLHIENRLRSSRLFN